MTHSTRPLPATVAGWVVCGAGAAAVIAALGNAVVMLTMDPAELRGRTSMLDPIVDHLAALRSTQTIMGLLTLCCGCALLRRQRWVRWPMRVLMALWIVLLLGFGLWMASWPPFGGRILLGGAAEELWKGIVVGNALGWSVLPLLVVWLLNRPATRQWLEASDRG